MSRDLVIRASADPEAAPEWALIVEGRKKRSGEGQPPDFETPIDRLFILLPGSDVFVSKITLAARSAREAAQAAPFLIEDELAAPVEDTRVVVGLPDSDGRRWVYAVRADLAETWSALEAELGARKTWFVPDGFAAMDEEEDLIVFGDQGDLVLCRPQADQPILRVENDLLAETLPAALGLEKLETLAVSDNIDWTEIVGLPLPQPRRFAAYDLAAKITTLPETLLDRLPTFAGAASSSSSNGLATFLPFRRTAVIACIALILSGVIMAGEGVYYRMQRDAIDDAGTALFAETFPDLRIVNPEAQLRQQIAAAGGTGGSDFLALATAVAELTRQVDSVEVQSLRYDRALNVLNVSARYGDFGDFEALNQAASELGVMLEDGGVRQAGGVLSGEFAVRLP